MGGSATITARNAPGKATVPGEPFKEPRIPLSRVLKQHWMLYVMLIPALVLLALFHYYPLWGIGIAFVNFSPAKGLLNSPWVGLGNFQRFFGSRNAINILRNTVAIAVGKIVLGQFSAVIFALVLNEVRSRLFKRGVQTITTLPNFLSWVIIGGIMVTFLSTTGPINTCKRLEQRRSASWAMPRSFPGPWSFPKRGRALGLGPSSTSQPSHRSTQSSTRPPRWMAPTAGGACCTSRCRGLRQSSR